AFFNGILFRTYILLYDILDFTYLIPSLAFLGKGFLRIIVLFLHEFRGVIMSKRSKKKSSKLKSPMKYELIGLLLIFIAIFGSGATVISDGAIPATLENIFRLMLGMWYFVIPIGLLLTGLLLLTNRRYPNMLHKKLIGI